MAIYGYIRVSTKEQNEERQKQALKEWECNNEKIDRVFIDKWTGRTLDRPQLKELESIVQPNDTIIVKDISRLARSLKDLLALVGEWDSKEIKIIFIKEHIDTKTKEGRLILGIMGSIYQFEVEMIKERQLEGVALAKEKGKYHGRKPIEFNPILLEGVMRKYMEGRISVSDACKSLSYTDKKGNTKYLTSPSFYRYFNKFLIDNNIKKVSYIQNGGDNNAES